MNISECDGIISRRWPVTIKYYWFGQRPRNEAKPDIAKLHSIPAPREGAINTESWTLITDLTKSPSELLSLLDSYTRNQVRRAEREGFKVEIFDLRQPEVLQEFYSFFQDFIKSKAEAQKILQISVQIHMLQRLLAAGMLEITRALGPGGEPLVYHALIVADNRARLLHSASLFRHDQNQERRQYLGWANRYLHWQEMLHYKQRGYTRYDLGGWYRGNDDQSLLKINKFKEEFGGKVICEYDAIYGCTKLGKLILPFRRLYRTTRDLILRR